MERPQDPGVARLEVLACAPGRRDLTPAVERHAVPGEVVIARDDAGALWCAAGLLPCGHCLPCQASTHLACVAGQHLGSDSPGGLAELVDLHLSGGFVAPLPQERCSAAEERAKVVALIAAGGSTYQAVASVGMSPGEAVVMRGQVGPGALPLRVLASQGLRVTWITENPALPLPSGVSSSPGAPAPESLSSSRIHLIDLDPQPGSMEDLSRLASVATSYTLLTTAPLSRDLPLAAALGGQAALRRFGALHPHLVLDVAALALSGRVDPGPWIETVGLAEFAGRFDALQHGEAERWPVLIP